MATTSHGTHLPIPRFRIVSIGSIVVFGVAAILWGCAVVPVFLQRYSVQRIAAGVLEGQVYELPLLQKALSTNLESSVVCQASALNAAAIVQLRMLETAVAEGERQSISERTQSLRATLRRALACSPTQSFLWLIQYWLEVSESGLNETAIEYLRMSYLTGPNEGWVSAKRNRFSLAIFDSLPSDIAAKVVPEFSSLVRSGFYRQAGSNVTGPGWSRREDLIASLAPVRERQKKIFSDYLRAEGVYIDIPGLPPIERRPWN